MSISELLRKMPLHEAANIAFGDGYSYFAVKNQESAFKAVGKEYVTYWEFQAGLKR